MTEGNSKFLGCHLWNSYAKTGAEVDLAGEDRDSAVGVDDEKLSSSVPSTGFPASFAAVWACVWGDEPEANDESAAGAQNVPA